MYPQFFEATCDRQLGQCVIGNLGICNEKHFQTLDEMEVGEICTGNLRVIEIDTPQVTQLIKRAQ